MNIPLHQVPALAAALTAAEASGMIDRVAVEPRSPADLARLCGVNANACEHILSVLKAFGLLTRDGNRYVAGEELRERARRPTLMRIESALWEHAPLFLRSGEPVMTMDAAPAERDRMYRDVVAELGTLFAPAADYLAEHAGLNPQSILDVGCGSGVWSLAFARRSPATHVTGLDLPAVLDQFRARADEIGVSSRVATIEGDMHTVAIPTGQWDLVVIANVLRLEPADRARALVARAAGALRPGGSLLVVDALASGNPAAEQARAVYALHLAMRTRSGRVHTANELRGWMQDAGCEPSREIRFDGVGMAAGALGALIAGKPM